MLPDEGAGDFDILGGSKKGAARAAQDACGLRRLRRRGAGPSPARLSAPGS
jgi:hypothetical protein